jgi:hypothetical protein
MVIFIEVPPAEEDDPAPEFGIGAIQERTVGKRKKTVPR